MGQATGLRSEQREQLLGAMVTVVTEKGYDATRVADVLAVAGLSRSAFYRNFDNKQECFLAALDRIAALSHQVVLERFGAADGPWDRKLEAMLRAFAEMIADAPSVARLRWVEAYAAGPEAVAHVEAMNGRIDEMVIEALADSPERADMPREVVRAILGGLRKIVHTRLIQGRERELPALVPGMLEWGLSYHSPPAALNRPSEPPVDLVPPRPAAEDPRERILLAVPDIVAEAGYPALTVTEIARRGAVSLSTFYGCFAGKKEAFVEAIAFGQRRIYFATAPAYEAAKDWPHAVAAALHAFLAFMTLEGSTARLAGVGAYEGGGAGLAKRDEAIAAAHAFLEEGFRLHPDTPRVAAEAIGDSIYALLSDQIRRDGADRLYEIAPTAAFIALAPFVGSDEACAVANAPVRPIPHASG
jgi:AcrR family transcriptional regulator